MIDHIIVSDMHLTDSLYDGPPGRPGQLQVKSKRDFFAPFMPTFRNAFKHFVNEKTTVIFNGDIFDLLICNKDMIARSYWWMLEDLLQIPKQIKFIMGNHERAPKNLNYLKPIEDVAALCLSPDVRIKIEGFYRWYLYIGNNILVTHGDISDPQVIKHARLSALVAKVGGILELTWPEIYPAFGKLISRLNGLGRYGDADTYFLSLVQKVNSLGSKRMVYGHTHSVGYKEDFGIQGFNSGCWIEKKNLGLVGYDSADDHVELYHIIPKLDLSGEFTYTTLKVGGKNGKEKSAGTSGAINNN